MSKRKGPTPRNDGWNAIRFTKIVDATRGLGGERMFENKKYVIIVAVFVNDMKEGAWPGSTVVHLSIRRQDRAQGPFPWRDMQRIKSELVGSEAEAVEVYPASSRLLDGANQRHLFCTLPHQFFAFGFHDGRSVEDDASIAAYLETDEGHEWLRTRNMTREEVLGKGQQAPFEDGKNYDKGHDGLLWRFVKPPHALNCTKRQGHDFCDCGVDAPPSPPCQNISLAGVKS